MNFILMLPALSSGLHDMVYNPTVNYKAYNISNCTHLLNFSTAGSIIWSISSTGRLDRQSAFPFCSDIVLWSRKLYRLLALFSNMTGLYGLLRVVLVE
jgi:hypothetical protein